MWAPIKSNDSYEVSADGRVRSKARVVQRSNGVPRRVRERILVPAKAGKGYEVVCLYRDGRGAQRYVHHLVAEAFLGDRPEGAEVNHKDLDKANNSLDNLEYVTKAENMAHAKAAGRLNGSPKYTPDQIRQGHALASSGMLYREAASICGMNQDALEAACRGDNWSHLGLPPIRKAAKSS